MLVASTSEVYGKSAKLPFREDADLVMGPPSKTRWGYATSKLLDEFLAGLLEGISVARDRRSVLHRRSAPERATDGAPEFRPPGASRRTHHGPWRRQTDAELHLGRRCGVGGDGAGSGAEAVGEVFNIGNGAEVSIGDLALKVKAMTGSDSPIERVPYNQVFDDSFEDMPRRVPDIEKIARVVYKADRPPRRNHRSGH